MRHSLLHTRQVGELKPTVYLYQRSFLFAGGEDVKKLYVRATLKNERDGGAANDPTQNPGIAGSCFPLSMVGIPTGWLVWKMQVQFLSVVSF